MDDTDAPAKIPLIWASSAGGAYITYPVPTPSQIGITNGAASFYDGFPPNNFVPLASGGAGPFGKDFNGLLKQITGGLQWLQAGGPSFYDSAFSTVIGGYPAGALLSSASTLGNFWLNQVDDNASDPDTGGANWLALVLPGSLQLAHGECYLAQSSPTLIVLHRKNGDNLIIDGVQQQLTPQPQAANTGVYVNGTAGQNLAASTGYYVSTSMVSGTVTLKFWNKATYSHQPDAAVGNQGIEVISLSGTAQSADTLVGFVQTDGSSHFQAQGVGTLSWFNRKAIGLTTAFIITATVTGPPSPVVTEITTSLRTNFAAWGDEAINATGLGDATNDTNGNGSGITLDLDGTTFSSGNAPMYAATGGQLGGVVTIGSAAVSEGAHYMSLFGFMNPGGSGTFGPLVVNVTVRG